MSDLFNLKTYFILGQYQAAINESSRLKPRDEFAKIERDVYTYRSFIELGNYHIVIDEIKTGQTSPPLEVLKCLALFLADQINSKDVIEQLDKWILEKQFIEDEMSLLIMALTYVHVGKLQEALQCAFSNKLLEAFVKFYNLVNLLTFALN